MKLCFPEIDHVFDTEQPYVNTLVIENQKMFYHVLMDLFRQIDGEEGKAVLSLNNKLLSIPKYLECLTSFTPFDLNQKNLLSKANIQLEKLAMESEYYERVMEILSHLESLLLDMSVEMTGELEFSKINIGSLIKSIGLTFADEYTSLGEKIINYMELVREYDRDKLFVTVNLRSYLDDMETSLFFQTLLQHQFHVVMLENKEYNRFKNEHRYIIDSDLCEIF